MNDKKKIIAICGAFFILYLFVAFAAGFRFGRAHDRTGNSDSQRVKRYEDRNSSAVEAVGKLESGLNSVEEQMQGLGKQITDGITDVGELSAVGDRIAGASTDIAESAGRIEERIQRIESILSEAEEKSIVLEECSDCIDPGGGY